MLRLTLILSALILIGIGITAFTPASAYDRSTPTSKEQVMLSFAPLVKKVSPAVVNIYTKRVITRRYSPFGNDPFFEHFFGSDFRPPFGRSFTRKHLESSLGTGLIINQSGVVITNAHVVKDADEISVVLQDGREFDAKISLSDSGADLTVLRLETEGEDLPYARLKPSETLEVGDLVLAIGNPFGVGQTVTSGIVSALARSSLNINDFNFFIQTDAAINPGNSGGPLVAMDGSVVGINTAIYSRSGGSLGIGFAIPSEIVQTVIAAEKSGAQNASALRPWSGIKGQAVTPDIANSLGIPRPGGVLIAKLHKKSPAKKAGMKVGDIVTAINDKKVNDPAEMKFRLATVPVGKKAGINILREGKTKTLYMKTIAPPNDPPRNETILKGDHLLNGVTVANINPQIGVELGLDTDIQGVVVLKTNRQTRGSRLVSAGDIILSINADKIKDIGDLKRELEQAKEASSFSMTTERNGRKNQIVIR